MLTGLMFSADLQYFMDSNFPGWSPRCEHANENGKCTVAFKINDLQI